MARALGQAALGIIYPSRRTLKLILQLCPTCRPFCTSSIRVSSSDLYKYIHDHFRITDLVMAEHLVNHFRPDEREMLLRVLKHRVQKENGERESLSSMHPSVTQIKQLFAVNTLPFIGFGILDNMIMILAGEYIDQSLGALLCISTMAAAALGNIISDVAGVGLAHYVEMIVGRLGIKNPVLTAEQMESQRTRIAINLARALGLTVGCVIGMFPLLFFTIREKMTSDSCPKI